jgi:hypothetical protein
MRPRDDRLDAVAGAAERGNRVVSYQVAIINPATGAQVARWFSLEGTPKVQRRSLSYVLTDID